MAAAPAKTEQSAPAKVEQAAPAKVEQSAPAKVEQSAPAKVEQQPRRRWSRQPRQAEQPRQRWSSQHPQRWSRQHRQRPGRQHRQRRSKRHRRIRKTTTQLNAGEALFSPTPDDPAITASIDRLGFAGQPLCVDPEALAGMILAGLLTSDPTKAATHGCQIVPGDAKLEHLERSPSVFSLMRIIRVKVTSPTQPDLKSGFTIEMGR